MFVTIKGVRRQMTARHETSQSDHRLRQFASIGWPTRRPTPKSTCAAPKEPSIRAHFIRFSMKSPPSKIISSENFTKRKKLSKASYFSFFLKKKKEEENGFRSRSWMRPLGPISALPTRRQSRVTCSRELNAGIKAINIITSKN